ncbi:hypothetical protein ACVWYI_001492 [Bradyrhizobium sp. LB13.1]
MVSLPSASNTWIAPKFLAVVAWSNRIRCRIGFETVAISGSSMLPATAFRDKS